MATTIASSTAATIDPNDAETLNWLFGWLIIGMAGLLISKTKSGYAAIYYGLLLLVILVAITQSQYILNEVVLATSQSVPNSGPIMSNSCTGNGTCIAADGHAGFCTNGVCNPITSIQQNAFTFGNGLQAGGIITL